MKIEKNINIDGVDLPNRIFALIGGYSGASFIKDNLFLNFSYMMSNIVDVYEYRNPEGFSEEQIQKLLKKESTVGVALCNSREGKNKKLVVFSSNDYRLKHKIYMYDNDGINSLPISKAIYTYCKHKLSKIKTNDVRWGDLVADHLTEELLIDLID